MHHGIQRVHLHWPDPDVSVDESLDALEDLRTQEPVRFVGAGDLDQKVDFLSA